MPDYDLVVIGAGSGGVRAARFAAQTYGIKAAIVELPFAFLPSRKTGGAGGTCVIRGCVPKKLLWYGSAFDADFKDSKGFGWATDSPPLDFKLLMEKKGKEIVRLNSVYMSLLKNAGVDFYEGHGSFVDAHTVHVDLAAGGSERLTGKHILIATGGHAVKAPIPGNEYAITSDDALILPELPTKPVVVVGAGYIACEFAGILNGFGSTVHQLYRADKPLRGFDEECRAQVAENLSERGINLHPSSEPTRIEKAKDGSLVVHLKEGGKEASLEAGLVLFGTGRAPNTKFLNLQAAGVKTNAKGAIVVNELSQTSTEHIYAIGDVTNRLDLTPVAIMEAMAFAATVYGNKPSPVTYKNIASAVFTQPPLGTVGLSEEEAQAQLAGPIDVYVSKFKPMKNTITGGTEKTLMKVIVKADTDEVVGVHMVGDYSAEIMQGIAIAMKCGVKKSHFDTTVGIHPTSAEEFVSMRQKTRRVEGKGSAHSYSDLA